MAFAPAISLGAYWLGGEPALLATAVLAPTLMTALKVFSAPNDGPPRDSMSGLMIRDGFVAQTNAIFEETSTPGRTSATLFLEMDEFEAVVARHGQSGADKILFQIGERLVSTLRDGDNVTRYAQNCFAITLKPVRQLDLELCIQMASRLQLAVEDPVSIDGAAVYLSASVGFCLRSRCVGTTGQDWLDCGETALAEARRHGPSAVRAFSAQLHQQRVAKGKLFDEVTAALDAGQIQPWFQPQISTDTGKVTGFEALARWFHPDRGMIPPADFLDAIEEAGLLERLAEVMMYHSLTALKAWDQAGLDIPQIGVNFAGPELQNPNLVEKIKWELDRFELTPDRLAVEVLETVVADSPDDVIALNINGLGELGCRIDLDDFGTGHASISAIRRFSVNRIKIDRSFVMKADRDPEQQRMIGAILSMAERLNLETLAEGVETVGEHALLAQLGCHHVQGFGIGRPMPFDKTLDWIAAHEAKLETAPRIAGAARPKSGKA
jgi:diguanylate cyclase (GGDEF)-like protein